MSILLITDTQLGMALKNIKFGKWAEKALNWSDALDPVSYTHLTLPTNREV